MVDTPRVRMTAREYLELPETNQIVELIDGELLMTPPPLDAHQESSVQALRFLLPLLKTGYLRHAPSGVHFDDGNNFEPDIFWISPQNDHCILGDDGRMWHGAPDFIIEILSPSTAYRDRGIKFETYEKYGVGEYWILDAELKFVEVYHHENGAYKRQGLYKTGQSFTSNILGGITVPVDTLFG